MAKDGKNNVYLTIHQLSEKYPIKTSWGWRRIIEKNEEFRKKCVRRIGNNIVIKEEELLKFIENSKY